MEPTPPIKTFLRTSSVTEVSISDAVYKRALNDKALFDRIHDLRPLVQDAIRENRRRSREAASRGANPHLTEGDFVLVAQEDFYAGGNICLG